MASYDLGHCRLDVDAGVVHWPERTYRLVEFDAEVLRLLVQSRQPMPAYLLVWRLGRRRGPISERAVRNAVRRLRGLLEWDPSEPTVLRTVHGTGYVLRLPSVAHALEPFVAPDLDELFGQDDHHAVIVAFSLDARELPRDWSHRLLQVVDAGWETDAYISSVRPGSTVVTIEGLNRDQADRLLAMTEDGSLESVLGTPIDTAVKGRVYASSVDAAGVGEAKRLILSMFNREELRMWLSEWSRGLEREVDWVGSDRVVFSEVIEAVVRRGLFTEDLFKSLLKARPGQAAAILDIGKANGLRLPESAEAELLEFAGGDFADSTWMREPATPRWPLIGEDD